MFEPAVDPTGALAPTRRRPQPFGVLTSAQIRAGRGLLNWSAAELARRAGVSWHSIQRAERADGVPRMTITTMEKIRQAFEAAGVEFTQNANGMGVRLRRRP